MLVSPEIKIRILWPFQLQRLKNEWHVRIDHSEELRKEAAKEKYSRTREKQPGKRNASSIFLSQNRFCLLLVVSRFLIVECKVNIGSRPLWTLEGLYQCILKSNIWYLNILCTSCWTLHKVLALVCSFLTAWKVRACKFINVKAKITCRCASFQKIM